MKWIKLASRILVDSLYRGATITGHIEVKN